MARRGVTAKCGGKKVHFKSKAAKRRYEAYRHIHLKKGGGTGGGTRHK